MTNGSFLRNSISPHAPRARNTEKIFSSRLLSPSYPCAPLYVSPSVALVAIYRDIHISHFFSSHNNDPQILHSTFSSLAFRIQFFFLAPIDFDDDRRRRRQRRPVDSSTSSVSMNEGGNISAGISATGIIMFAPLSLPSSIDFRNYFVYTVVI